MSAPITAPVLSLPEREPGPASTPQAKIANEEPTTNAPAASTAAPEPEHTSASAAQAAVTNVVSLARAENPVPDFRLKGIIYTATRPTAIVNGRTVRVGDEVNGAIVLKITWDRVLLLSNGELKTLELP